MSRSLRILVVEDQPAIAELIGQALNRGGVAALLECVASASALKKALTTGSWDVVLSSGSLPHFGARDALSMVRDVDPDLPFIVISDAIGEEHAVEMMRAGANDYVLKDRLTRLAPAVEREVRQAAHRRARRSAEQDAFRLAAIVSATNDAVIWETLEGTIASWNPGAERLFGWTVGEAMGRPVADLTPHDLRDELAAATDRLRTTGQPEHLETVRLCRDGKRIDVSVTISPVRNTKGQVIGYAHIARNTTDQIRAERERARLQHELNERHKELRALHQTATLLQNELTDPAELFEKVAALLPPAWQCPDITAARIKYNKTTVATANFRETPWRLVAPIVTPSDHGVIEVVYLEERPPLDEGPFLKEEREVLDSLAEMLRAYLERHEALQAVRASEARFKALVEKSHEAITLLDADGTIRYVSSATKTITGLEPSELVGKSTFNFCAPEEIPNHLAFFRELIAQPGTVRSHPGRIMHKNGSVRDVESTFTNLLTDPDLQAIVINSRDVTEQKRAAAALRESEDRYRQLADAMPQIVWITKHDGYHEYYNRQWYEYTGLTYEQSKGEGWRLVFHPDDQPVAWRRWQHSLATGEPFETEYRCRRHDGMYRWFLGRALPQRDENGGIVRWFGTCTDIHDFKQAQADRDELLNWLDLQVERIPLAYLLSGPDFRYLRWNPAAERIFGFAEADVLGKHPFDVIVPYSSQELMGAIFERLKAGDMNAHGTCENITRDRRTIVCEWHNTPLFNADGSFQGVLSLAQDVTKRVEAEESLRLKERAIRAVTQGIVFTDPTRPGNPIIYASPGFERLTGYSAQEVIGRNCRFLQGKDTDPEALARVREAIRAGEPCTVELLNYKKDGTPFWNELSISPVRDETGQLTHFVGVQVDVTQRRKLENQFRHAQKMDAIGRLAGGIAHDFNNLLTVINGYSELLLQTLPQNDPARESVVEIHKAGERSAALTRQLLAFSRQQVLAPRVLDLNAVIADAEKMLRRVIGEDIELAASLDPELGPVRADPGQLEQVLLNLAVNARDAMPTGGQLTIETRNIELDAFFAHSHPDIRPGPHVQLTVADTGIGMTPEVKARIFEPFFTTKGQGKGTGLGLATVFGIIQQSGGTVEVYSEEGMGATFKIYLPRVDEPVVGPKPRSSVQTPPRGNETIMLVEDEDGVRALTQHFLSNCGYTVLTAANGYEAIRLLNRHDGPIHLLITDVVMPGPAGPIVAEHVQARYPTVRVLFISGYTDDAVVRHGILSEQVDFLQKPFSPVSLAFKVREVLDHTP